MNPANLSFQPLCELLASGSLLFPFVVDGGRMAVDDKRDSDRRGEDRRSADDPDYKGPERRKGDRRSGKERRETDRS